MLRKVLTETGWVEGIPAADPRITAFKGIPYAAAPVGENRWRAPRPAEKWDGIRKCYTFGPIAMQGVPGINPDGLYAREWHVDPEIEMSEDCLQLNVWTNAKTGDEKMPVMVWFFGGGLNEGYTAEMEMDGERIARRGVILVSVNYRLNVFGFLAHPELTAEDPEFPTNFGHLDQRAGIEWVRRNIAAFGGDPDNITIFGQSAGAGSCQVQVCSPMNKGLFQRAILHSGAGLLPPAAYSFTLPDAEEQGKRFFEAIGVSTLAEARKVDAKTLWEVAMKSRKFSWGTVIGDKFMPDYPVEMIKRGEQNDMPLIIGNTENEFPSAPNASSVEELEAYAREKFGDKADGYLAIAKDGASTFEEMMQKAKYNGFELGDLMWLDLNNRKPKNKMYFYKFNPEIPGWDNPGSFHSSDLWFVFESLAKCWRPFTGKHYDLARQMCNYWTNFARCGDPNGNDADGTPMAEWKPFTEDCQKCMYFGDKPEFTDAASTESAEYLRKCYAEGAVSELALNTFGAAFFGKK